MKLDLLTSTPDQYMPIICEGYGRVYYFHYLGWKHDPHPRALFLGRYIHPSTRNLLMSAINLNYLSESQIVKLQKNLHEILSYSRNGYYRYWRARQLGLNDIMSTAYRTYRVDRIDGVEGVSPSTLRFIAEGIKQERQKKTKTRKPLPEPSISHAEKPEAKLEPEPEEELPPEVDKAKVPPRHPDEEMDISKIPPEEMEKLKKGTEAKPKPAKPDKKVKAEFEPKPKTKPKPEPEEPEEPEEEPEEDDDTEWDLSLSD